MINDGDKLIKQNCSYLSNLEFREKQDNFIRLENQMGWTSCAKSSAEFSICVVPYRISRLNLMVMNASSLE